MEENKETLSYSLSKEDFSKEIKTVNIEEIPHLFDKVEKLRKMEDLFKTLESSIENEIENVPKSGLIKPFEANDYSEYRFKLSKQINGKTFNIRIIDFKSEEKLNRKLGLANDVLNIESPFEVTTTFFYFNGELYEYEAYFKFMRYVKQMMIDELLDLSNNQQMMFTISDFFPSPFYKKSPIFESLYRILAEAKGHYFENIKKYDNTLLNYYVYDLSSIKIRTDVLLTDEYYKIVKIDLLFKAISENFNDLKFYEIGFDFKHVISILRNYQYFLTYELISVYKENYFDVVRDRIMKEKANKEEQE